MSINKLLHVTPIDTHNEVVTEVRYYPDQPVYGLQGYFDDNLCISMYDMDNIPLEVIENFAKANFITPSIIYKTKKGYHLYNFEITNLTRWARIGLEHMVDLKHIGYSLCKGYPTLRAGIKERSYEEPDITFKKIVIPYKADMRIRLLETPVSWTHVDFVTHILPIPNREYHKVVDGIKYCNLMKYQGKLPLGVIYR